VNPDPRISVALESLLQADHECEQLIKEVEEYDWDHDPYPLGPGFIPYPEKDMDRFHDRGRDAKNLKVRILAILRGLGSLGDPWCKHIEEVNFHEAYALSNPFLNAPKRPSVSGLTAAREVLKSARAILTSAPSDEALTEKAPKRRRGPEPDIDTARKVAEIVALHGEDWQSQDALEKICKALDKAGVPISKAWEKWRPKVHTWERAWENRPRPVVQAIEHRLKTAQRD